MTDDPVIAAERAAIQAAVGKTISTIEDEGDNFARESLVLHFTDGTRLGLASCSCCSGIGVFDASDSDRSVG